MEMIARKHSPFTASEGASFMVHPCHVLCLFSAGVLEVTSTDYSHPDPHIVFTGDVRQAVGLLPKIDCVLGALCDAVPEEALCTP
jgi:hypothetical protein